MIYLEFISGATNYDSLTDEYLPRYLKEKAKQLCEEATAESIFRIVEFELQSYMTNTDTKFRTKNCFAKYITLLCRSGLLWIIRENPEIVVKHDCNVILPVTLRRRIESVLRSSQERLLKDLRTFWQHAIRPADYFRLVNNGKRSPGTAIAGVTEVKLKRRKAGNPERRQMPNARRRRRTRKVLTRTRLQSKQFTCAVCTRQRELAVSLMTSRPVCKSKIKRFSTNITK